MTGKNKDIEDKINLFKTLLPEELSMGSLRNMIDFLDSELIILLGLRMECSKLVGSYKKTKGLEIFDPTREIALIEKVLKLAENRLSPEFVKSVYKLILEESKSLQK